MRRTRLNSGYSFNTDQRRTKAGTISASKHFAERSLGVFFAGWTPSAISTAIWLDASDTNSVTLSGTSVTEWRDKSGNSRHATPGASPVYETSVQNGLNAVSFVPVDYLRSTWSVASSQATSAFLVVKPDNITSNNRVLSGALSGAERRNFTFILDNYNIYDGTNGYTSTGGTDTNWKVMSIIYNTTGIIYANGTSVLTQNPFSLSSFGYVDFGAGNGINGYDGYIGEIILLDSAASTDTRQTIEGYLAHKWGLQANLPANHPYKNVAPLG